MTNDVEWRVEPGLADYLVAVAVMEDRAAAIHRGQARELIWLVEHPPMYTAGTSAQPVDLLDARFPVFATGRGGRFTYHGPGQRVIYVMLDLNRRGRDVRRFVAALEGWIAAALAGMAIASFVVPGRVGVWTGPADDAAKIAAIGVRVRRWVTLHGGAVNVAPDLDHFEGIVPCGLVDARVTSIAALRGPTTLVAFDRLLLTTLPAFLAKLAIAPAAMPLEQVDHLG